ncbi:MAG: AMP-binding protein [Nitriliruptoraceae bacterium]
MTTLHAVKGPASAVVPWLAATWAGGDAALVLPTDAPPARIDALLTRLRPATLTDLSDHDAPSRPVALAAMPVPPGAIRELPDPMPTAAEVRLVVATSGSTGEPKGVELTSAALESATRSSLTRLGALAGERWGLALPLHHVAGIAVVRRAWALRTEPVLVPSRAALATAEAEHLALVPTQLARALDDGVDLARFRSILLGGARPPQTLLARAREAGARVVVSYGMTETAGGCVYDGLPLDGVEVEVGADGRIRLGGPMLFHAYRGAPQATEQAFEGSRFLTGDLGRWRDGRLEVLGRADEVAISGGENVALPAVEEALRTHPAVADAAASAQADPDWGEVVVAVVVPRDPDAAPTLEQLRAHVRAELPVSHAPRSLRLVDALPRDALGKLARTELDRLVDGADPATDHRSA